MPPPIRPPATARPAPTPHPIRARSVSLLTEGELGPAVLGADVLGMAVGVGVALAAPYSG